MGALRTREDGRLPGKRSLGSRLKLHIQTRASQQTQARSGMLPPTPITPEDRGHAHVEGMRASRSPGADAWWSLRATALATGRYDRSHSELHRRSAGSHLLRCAVRPETGLCLLGTLPSHRAGGQKLAHRSAPPSRLLRPPAGHSQPQAPARL